MNFIMEIDTPRSQHEHKTWGSDKWILVTLEVFGDSFGLTKDDIVPLPLDHKMSPMILSIFS